MGRGQQGGECPGMRSELITRAQEAPSVGADVPQTRCAQSRAKLGTTHGLGLKGSVLEVACAPHCSCWGQVRAKTGLEGAVLSNYPPSLSAELWTNATTPRKQFL